MLVGKTNCLSITNHKEPLQFSHYSLLAFHYHQYPKKLKLSKSCWTTRLYPMWLWISKNFKWTGKTVRFQILLGSLPQFPKLNLDLYEKYVGLVWTCIFCIICKNFPQWCLASSKKISQIMGKSTVMFDQKISHFSCSIPKNGKKSFWQKERKGKKGKGSNFSSPPFYLYCLLPFLLDLSFTFTDLDEFLAY